MKRHTKDVILMRGHLLALTPKMQWFNESSLGKHTSVMKIIIGSML